MNAEAEVHRLKSEYFSARDIQLQLLHENSADMDPYRHAWALVNVAEIDVSSIFQDDVQGKIHAAKSLFTAIEDVRGVRYCDVIQANLSLREGKILAAKTLFQDSLKFSWGKYNDIVSLCLESLGNSSYWNISHCTPAWTTMFLIHSLKGKAKLEIHKGLQFFGDVFLTEGEENTAISLLTVALEGFTYMDVHCSSAEYMLRLGDISSKHGELVKAVELWKTARPQPERSSQAKQAEQIYARLASIHQNVLKKHVNNLAHLAELNTPAGTSEVSDDDDLSEVEGRAELDLNDEAEPVLGTADYKLSMFQLLLSCL
jgi:hypothetical protein